MDELSFKVGRYEAEAMTAMVRTPAGPLFLSRVLPGRWAIQRPGAPDGAATPSWDGEAFVTPKVPFFKAERLEEEVFKASGFLAAEAAGASRDN
jgi:hypothetical protein